MFTSFLHLFANLILFRYCNRVYDLFTIGKLFNLRLHTGYKKMMYFNINSIKKHIIKSTLKNKYMYDKQTAELQHLSKSHYKFI